MKIFQKTLKSFLLITLMTGVGFFIVSELNITGAMAGIGDNYGYWQTWSGLYVSTYHDAGNGDVSIRFLNKNGADYLGWSFKNENVCSNSPWLIISRDHPQH